MPKMIVIAGPPGSGKSTVFPASSFGVDSFNADDRAAALNDGSYRAITPEIRAQVNNEFEAFVQEHIRSRTSFAFETTLRTDITLKQAAEAKQAGFEVGMKYLAVGTLQQHLERVAARAEGGGHAASSSTLRRIYDASLRNLAAALKIVDAVEVFDNAQFGKKPRLVLESERGQVHYIAHSVPAWLEGALKGTDYEINSRLRDEVRKRETENRRGS